MPPPANTKEFLQLLDRSGLVESSRIKDSLNKIRASGAKPTSPQELAQLLIDDELITRFHADQLLSGRHKGFMVGKYKILELIGSGGMGRVYLAEHVIMRRRVAVKVLPRAKSADPSALGRFQREARAVAALKHPNIVQAYDIDEDRDLHYMVMEYVEGMSVQEYVKKFGPIPWGQAADYICQAADALEHANQAGLIHRDIKPGNLLIDTSGTVKLLDLGLAVFFEESDRESLTLAFDENVLGTADYLSPEQALDSHKVDIRSDIYSLGGTFYYMLTGGPPFPEGTITQKLLWHQHKMPNPVEELAPDLPPELPPIIRKMMAKKRDERYATPGEVCEALAPFAQRVENPFQDKPVRLRTSKPPSSRQQNATSAMSSQKNQKLAVEQDKQRGRKEGGSTTKPLPPSPPSPSLPETVQFEPLVEEESPFIFGDQASGLQSRSQPSVEVADEADDFFSSISDSAKSSGPTVEASTAASDTLVGNSSSKELANPAPNPRKKVYIAAGAAAVMIVGLAAAMWLMPRDEPEPIAPKVENTVKEPPPGPDLSNALVVRRTESPKSDAPTYFTVDEALLDAKPGQKIYIDGNGPWNLIPLEIGPNSLLYPGKDRITIEGATPDTVLQRIGGTGPFLTIEGAREVTLRNLIIDGGGEMGPVLEIRGPNVTGFKAENVRIRNFQGIGIQIISADGQPANPISFNGFTIQMADPVGQAIVICPPETGATTSNTTNVEFKSGEITGPFAMGLHVTQSVRGLTIEETTISGGETGIRVASAHSGWRINGNKFVELRTAIQSTIENDKSANDIGVFENNNMERVGVPFTSPGATPAPPP